MQDHRRAYGTPLLVWMGTKTYLWEEIFGREAQDKKVNPMGNGWSCFANQANIQLAP